MKKGEAEGVKVAKGAGAEEFRKSANVDLSKFKAKEAGLERPRISAVDTNGGELILITLVDSVLFMVYDP